MDKHTWNLSRALALVFLFASVAATGWLLADDDEEWEHGREGGSYESDGGGHGMEGGHEGGARALTPVTNAKWKEECSSCHMLYHPGLLPERSWRAVMAGLDKHFGEDARIDAKVRDEITSFLAVNSADRAANRRSARIAQSIPPRTTPLRITDTAFFVRKHDELRPEVFKRPKVGSASNCVACHAGAEQGQFSEHAVRIPR